MAKPTSAEESGDNNPSEDAGANAARWDGSVTKQKYIDAEASDSKP